MRLEIREKAVALRKKGFSYSYISKQLGIKSKGTLSTWFKNIKLSNRSRILLEKNNALAHKRGLFISNENRIKRILSENKSAFNEGYDITKTTSKSDLTIIGPALYWAEGMKSQTRTSASLVFSNSDPKMIFLFMKFLREILLVPDKKIRSGIHLYKSINIDEAKDYWSKITSLSSHEFYIVTQVSSRSKNKRPKNILPYGTLSVKINDRIVFHKVMGMIGGIIESLNN
jgi:hypothetical protein